MTFPYRRDGQPERRKEGVIKFGEINEMKVKLKIIGSLVISLVGKRCLKFKLIIGSEGIEPTFLD